MVEAVKDRERNKGILHLTDCSIRYLHPYIEQQGQRSQGKNCDTEEDK